MRYRVWRSYIANYLPADLHGQQHRSPAKPCPMLDDFGIAFIFTHDGSSSPSHPVSRYHVTCSTPCFCSTAIASLKNAPDCPALGNHGCTNVWVLSPSRLSQTSPSHGCPVSLQTKPKNLRIVPRTRSDTRKS